MKKAIKKELAVDEKHQALKDEKSSIGNSITLNTEKSIVLSNLPEEIFLTIEEAAELEGTSYESMKKRIQRNKNVMDTKFEEKSNNGKDRVLVALSSLSKKARRTYKKNTEVANEKPESEKNTEEPWYTTVDLNWYIENNESMYYKAVSLAQDIKAFLEYNEDDRTTFADEFATELKVSQRTLYRYAESYLEGESWALSYTKVDEKNYDYFKVLALCRKPKQSNTFPSLTPEHRAFIENVWFDKEFARNNGTIEMLYTQFVRKFMEKNQDVSSYQTVARYINHIMKNKKMGNVRILAERGEKEWRRNVMMKCLRDTSTVPVLGIVQGDSHTFDFWVEYKDPDNGKISAIRPTMVAWIDTRSRVVMGCVLAKNVNAQVVKQSMVKLVYDYGVPKCILIDNGKDYTAKEMLGRSRKERNKLLTLDKESTGFYRSLGIVDDYRTLPYQPWSKGPIERFFGTVCNQFSKWFGSYTGTLTGSKTSAKVKKDVDRLLADGKLVTMNEAHDLFDLWLNETYHKKKHGGLKAMKEKWTTPMALFENAENRIEIPPPPRELAETLLMKPGKAVVRQIGIKKLGEVYMDYALTSYIGQTLDIRYDPSDMTKIYVYDSTGYKICEAKCQKLLQYQGLITEKQLQDHKKLQKMQEKADKNRMALATTPYELRGINGDQMVAGKIDLMIEKKPVKCAIEPLIVKEIKASVKNEYFEQKAQEALKKLREGGTE